MRATRLVIFLLIYYKNWENKSVKTHSKYEVVWFMLRDTG
jgi:hypothetical protein